MIKNKMINLFVTVPTFLLFSSCAIISSNVKHSEWMQLKEERAKDITNQVKDIKVVCEATNSARIRFVSNFEIYCDEIRKSLRLISRQLTEKGIDNLLVKVEVLPFANPSRWQYTPYSAMIFPLVDSDGKIVVSWYSQKELQTVKTLIQTSDLKFDMYSYFWLFIGFGQYDLGKKLYQDRWYSGEGFWANLGGNNYAAELAIILNRRMVQQELDSKK